MKRKNLKIKTGGFTIIEMMIAISLFLVVIMFGMGSLLNANLIHRKSQDMRSIMDNLSFIMEDMSRNLRTGENYHCIMTGGDFNDIESPQSCAEEGGGGIAFLSSSGEEWVYYILDKKIFKSTQQPYASGIELSSEGIEIDTGTFTVIGAEPGDGQQPLVIIRLAGKMVSPKGDTPFSLQTSVSQRLIDTAVSPSLPLSSPKLPILPTKKVI